MVFAGITHYTHLQTDNLSNAKKTVGVKIIENVYYCFLAKHLSKIYLMFKILY